MDYAPKIKKIDLKPAPKIRSSLSLPVSHLTSADSAVEDRRLVNWKRWLADRKKHYKVYKTIVGRNQDELLLNSCEKFRSLVETRELMELAADPMLSSDAEKGDLGFWATPEFLPNRGDPCLPEIAPVLTKKQLGTVPELVHVSLPKLIRVEKGLEHLEKSTSAKNEYLKKRVAELADLIPLLEPNLPEMENLAVQGKRFGHDAKERYNRKLTIPVISITNDLETEMETSDWSVDPDSMIAALRIQDTDVIRILNSKYRSKDADQESFEWNLKFISEDSSLPEHKIVLENRGNIAITYCWSLAPVPFSEFPTAKRVTSPFFFNKNKGIIVPGQIHEFSIWFKCTQPAIVMETWRLNTEPILCPSGLLIRLWGSLSDELMQKETFLREKNARCANECLLQRNRDTAIRQILEEIIDKAVGTLPPEPPYERFFIERDIFCAKNPSYYYHPTLVNELHKLFNSTMNAEGQTWNLSLTDLRSTLLGIGDSKRRQQVLILFSELCQSCLEPSSYTLPKSQKHEMVYSLLCSFANRFELESDNVKNCFFFSTEAKSATSATSVQSRSTSSTARTSAETFTPRPKTKLRKLNRGVGARLPISKERDERTLDERVPRRKISSPIEITFLREIFYLRIYELLGDTISRACAAIDSYHRLNDPEK